MYLLHEHVAGAVEEEEGQRDAVQRRPAGLVFILRGIGIIGWSLVGGGTVLIVA